MHYQQQRRRVLRIAAAAVRGREVGSLVGERRIWKLGRLGEEGEGEEACLLYKLLWGEEVEVRREEVWVDRVWFLLRRGKRHLQQEGRDPVN